MMKNIYIWILIFTASVLQVAWSMGNLLLQGNLTDFGYYYTEARLFISGGNPYLPPHPFNYPPTFLLILSPLALLPQKTAEIIFTFASLVSLLASVYFFTKLFIKSLPVKLFIVSILLLSFPTKFTLGMGQINLITLLFITLAFYYDQKGKEAVSGILWSLAIMLRISPITLGLYYLVRKKFISLASGIGGFFAVNALIILLRGWQSSYFLTALPGFYGSINNASSYYDQSLHAFLFRLGFGNYSLVISSVIIGLMGILSIYLYIYSSNNLSVNNNQLTINNLTFFSLILALTTLGNSYAWQHHFVFLFPGFIILSIYVFKNRSFSKIALLLSIAFLTGYHFPDPYHPPSTDPFLFSHTFLGGFLLIILLIKNLGKIAGR